MAYGVLKDLIRRTAADKALHDKVFSIAKNSNYDGYQRGLASMVYVLIKKNSGKTVKNESISNTIKKLIKKFKKRKVQSLFKCLRC